MPARLAAFAAVLLFCAAPRVHSAPPEQVQELDKKIKYHKKDLQKLQEQIQGLEQERKKLKQDETILSTTLKRIEVEIDQSVKKQSKVKTQMTQSEAKIKKLSAQAQVLTGEKAKWEQLVMADVNAYYVRSVYPQRLSGSHLEKLLTNSLMLRKFQSLRSVEKSKKIAQDQEVRLVRAKENLTVLRAQLETELVKQKKSQAEKSELYKTTSGRRIAAEQEADRLRDTAQSLESMIGRLKKRKEKDRQKTLAAQKQAELERKDVEVRKGSLPWPAAGAVSVPFGRQKHAELNITVINNGIKIRTQSGTAVKAVEKGTVVYADDFRSYGQTVIVDHGGDFYTIYGLLGSILVKDGQKIEAGRIIGNASADPQPQIYFEVRSEGHPENPLQWLK